MAVNQSFTTDEVTATGSSQQVDLGFKPKVMFSMGCGVEAADIGTTFHHDAWAGFGWSPDPASGVQTSVGSGGRVSSTGAGSGISESIFAAYQSCPHLGEKTIDMVSFNCDTDVGHAESGYTWQPAVTYRTGVQPTIALGGDDISVATGSFSWPGSASDVAVTGVGFEPQLVMLLWSKVSAFGENPALCAAGGAGMGFGAASSPDAGESFSWYSASDGGPGGYTTFLTDTIAMCSSNAAVLATGTLASMDADGFTISFDGPDTGETMTVTPRLLGWIALRNDGDVADPGGFKVGYETAPVASGDQAFTGCGFQPDQVIVAHPNAVTPDSFLGALGSFGFGMFDDTLQSSFLSGEQMLGFPIYGARVHDNTVAQFMASAYGVLDATATRSSMDVDGFTLDWDIAVGGGQPFGWIAMHTTGDNGDCGDGPPPVQVAAYQRMYGWRASIDDNALETVEVFTSPQGFTS